MIRLWHTESIEKLLNAYHFFKKKAKSMNFAKLVTFLISMFLSAAKALQLHSVRFLFQLQNTLLK